MPEPLGREQRYMPGLDGLRALAVGAVVAYHLGLSWMPGGLLGVGVFFVLSGFLITDLLLSSWESSGGLQLRTFWARRARRLLPALFVMLVVVTIWAAAADPAQLGALRGDVAAAAAYVCNWWLIGQHVSYFARFGPPSPLGHLWSLAVEEQFYLIWPWLLWLGLVWARRRHRQAHSMAGPSGLDGPPQDLGKRAAYPAGADRAADLRALGHLLAGRAVLGPVPAQRESLGRQVAGRLGIPATRRWLLPLAALTVALAAASAVEMALLYHPSFDPSRVYDGTDTRACALLFGAALAMVWPSKGLSSEVAPGARWFVDVMGVMGLTAIALLMCCTDQYSPFLYRGGLVVLSLATVLVVAAAAHPASRLGQALGWQPLRWLGVRSYAIYLWHYPVIVLTSPPVAEGTNLPRAALQVGATLALAELSWRLVETPVRHGAIGRAWASVRTSPRSVLTVAPSRRLALGTLPVALLLTGLALGGVMPAVAGSRSSPETRPVRQTTAPTAVARTAALATTTTSTTSTTSTTTTTTTTSTTSTTTTTTTTSTTTTKASTTSTTPPQAQTFTTSCKEVVHVGDSTSESLVSSDYLPDASQRLAAQYARVGVTRSIMRIQGANSIVETLPGEQNAYRMAQELVEQGYRGCWVIALGTNDAADVYVGSNVSLAARVRKMMALIGDQPVLWVNAKTLLSGGPYSEANMQRWDKALVQACAAHPNMRVFNWAALAKPSWFTSDGIHYNSPGSAPRAAAIADALAVAFPVNAHGAAGHGGEQGPGCAVNGTPGWHLPTFHF